MDLIIDVGTGGTLGARAPQDFAVNKEVPILFLENARVYFGKKCPQSVMSLPPQVWDASYVPGIDPYSIISQLAGLRHK